MVNYVANVPKPSLSAPFKNDREGRSLAFFLERTAVELSRPFASEIWSRYVLQTAQTEPVVRHAVIALASLHEDSQAVGPAIFPDGDYARLHYAKAVQQFLNHPVVDNSQRVTLALILCVLFTTFDCLRGYTAAAFSHIQSGLRIIREETANGSASLLQPSVPWRAILLQFQHLESQIFEMQGRVSDGHDDEQTLAKRYSSESLPGTFGTLEEAQEALEELYNCLNHYLTLHPENIHKTAKHAKFVYYFNVWSAKFSAFQQSCLTKKTQDDTKRGITILQMWQKLLRTRLAFDFDGDEIAYDNHLSTFSSMVTLAQSVSHLQSKDGHPLKFSVSTGIVAPLYMTITRCRDPLVRRRALSLLKQSNCRDGLWASNVVAPVAERIMQLEEGAALSLMVKDESGAVISEASQIPESCRIGLLDVQFGNTRYGDISYGRPRLDNQGKRTRDYELVFAERLFW